MRVSSSHMGARASLWMTTSFSTSPSSTGAFAPGLCRWTWSLIRREVVALPARTCSTTGYISLCGTSVMKPRLPMLMPRMGAGRPARSEAAWMSVPSPPRTMTRSAPAAICRSSVRTSTPFCFRNWSTYGTVSAASALCFLWTIPTRRGTGHGWLAMSALLYRLRGPLRSRPGGGRVGQTAGRADAPPHPRGLRRAGARARPGDGPATRHRGGPGPVAAPLGAAGDREDDAGPDRRPPHRLGVHPLQRRAGGREGDPRDRRRRAGSPEDAAQADDPLRRRDPPVHARPAGRLPPARRGRHLLAHRRHHREPVLRGERRPPLALPRRDAARPHRGGGGGHARPGGGRAERAEGRGVARRRGARGARPLRLRRRAPRAQRAGSGGGLRPADRTDDDRETRRGGGAAAEDAPLRQGGRGALQRRLRLHQVVAGERSGRSRLLPGPDAGGGRGATLNYLEASGTS